MNVTVFSHGVPNKKHSTVTYSGYLYLQALVAAGHTTFLVCFVLETDNPEKREVRRRELEDVRCLGVEVELIEYAAPKARHRSAFVRRLIGLRTIIFPRVDDFYPQCRLRPQVAATLQRMQPDVIFFWSNYESLAAGLNIVPVPTFLLTGDPPHLPRLYRLKMIDESNRRPSLFQSLYRSLLARALGRITIRLIAQCDVVAAGADHYAEWFRGHGVPQCEHMYAVVPDWGGSAWRTAVGDHRMGDRVRILLFGHVTGTATLSGLYYLADEILPHLDQVLHGRYEVRICGKDELPDDLRSRLARPEVVVCGYVDDIVGEIRGSDVMLVPTPIPLGVRMRIAFAWSIGCCVVAHSANGVGLAALRHEENALLADNAAGLAEMIGRIGSDHELAERVMQGGRKTYECEFSPTIAGVRVVDVLASLANKNNISPLPQPQ